MQNAKDTFYVTLRNRLATLNPNRTMLLRGVAAARDLVEEAEAVVPMLPPDVFVLRWTALKIDVNLPLVLARLECEIHLHHWRNADCLGARPRPGAGRDGRRMLGLLVAKLLRQRSTTHRRRRCS